MQTLKVHLSVNSILMDHSSIKIGSEADIEIKPEDFVSANLELIFNSDTIAFEVEDLDGLITDIQELDARGDSKDGGYWRTVSISTRLCWHDQ
jgi:hypothetical protein